MLWVLVLVCAVSNVLGDGENVESLVVNIKQGSVRGYKSPDGDFYTFYGVPYATAPSGSQRFQAPLPAPVWSDTYEAIDRGVVCPQFDSIMGFTSGKDVRENCLIANVYVPDTEKKNLPVLVYVHGGAYIAGFGNMLTLKHLIMTKRVIIVNFNYRLGAHGFLCLGSKDVPGNAGMKDQVALLRWVKKNIASFGGNPDDVTLAGSSAGSSAVDLLQLSKMANNLFTKVIPESGANMAAFSIQVDPIETAKKFAKRLKFNNVDDIYALEEFYKTASYDTLISINVIEETDATFVFSPCVERDTGVEIFLDDSPLNILKSGKYLKRPMLYGFAKMEGAFRLPMFEAWKDGMTVRFSDYLPGDLVFESEEEKEAVALKVKTFFFGESVISGDNIMGYIDYFTDIIFAYPTLWSVKLQVEAGNNQIYLYEYDFIHDHSTLIPYANVRGANHCDQTMAIHDGITFFQLDETIISDDLKNMKHVIREIWLNFITTGKPIPEESPYPAWPPTNANASPYMVLDKTLELKKTPLLEKRRTLWDEIYCRYYRQPVPPIELPTQKHNMEL